MIQPDDVLLEVLTHAVRSAHPSLVLFIGHDVPSYEPRDALPSTRATVLQHRFALERALHDRIEGTDSANCSLRVALEREIRRLDQSLEQNNERN